MLDIRVLTFLKACDHMSFTAAARELNLTQPAVSKHIRYLEEYYGVKLFRYQNKKLTLTKEGLYLRNAMNAVNHDAIRIKEDIRSGTEKRRLKLGATLSIGNFSLPAPLIRYLKSHPETEINVTVADTRELLRCIDQGSLDFILCEGNFRKADYSHRLLKRSSLKAYCGAGYGTDGIKKVEDLLDRRILLREKGSGTREIFEHFLREKGYGTEQFESCYEIGSSELIVKMLLEDMGFSVLYTDVCDAYVREGRLKEIRLEDMSLTHEFNAVWAKNSIHGVEYEEIVRELCSGAEDFCESEHAF